MTYISFPGLGIDRFHINSTAFSIFGLEIAWYGIIICFGLILGVLYSIFRAKKNEGIKTDTVIDLAFFLVIFGVIGARLYYIIFKFGDYIRTKADGSFDLGKTLLAMINIREGGLAIYGALIAGFLTILVFSKVKKIRFLKILDFVSPAVMIGQIIGRWGNFVNMEAHGTETTLPWRMGLHVSNFSDPSIAGSMTSDIYVHPTFLYESLWNLVGFLIINAIYKKKKFDGQIFFMYIAWYGLGRAFIEGLRTDSLMLGVVRVSQLVGAITFIVGLSFLIIFAQKTRREVAVPEGVSTLDISDGESSDSDLSVHDGIYDETALNRQDEPDTEDNVEDDASESENSVDGEEDGEDN